MSRFLMPLLWLMLVFFAARLVPNWQLKANYEDLLPASAKQVLAQQPALSIDVFALPNSPAASLVDNFLQPITDILPDVQVNYIDANQNPALVSQYQISKQGEMVVQSNDSGFQLSTLSYEAFFNGLKKMNQPNDQWMVFLDNLGGRSFDEGHAGSFSDWLKALKAANYPAIVLPWQPQLVLPKQTKLIIFASPAIHMSQAHMIWLESQINAGLSVMWLADPQTVISQPELSLLFDVMRTESFHSGHVVIKDFPVHPINASFDRPLDLVDVMPFETTNKPLWFNDQQQVLAATQEVGDSRLMVVGDSDFLANEFLNSGGNLEMSYRLLDWLMRHDNRIDLPSIGMGQTQLFFSQFEVLMFAGIMLLLMPLLLLIIGIYFWRKNK